MKYFLLLAVVLMQFSIAKAQPTQASVAKVFKVNTTTKSVVDLDMMGHQTQMQTDMAMQMQFELTALRPNGYSLKVTPNHMNMLFSMNGMEQKMDTDNESDKANPVYAKLFELINQPQTIEVENNQVVKNSLQSQINPNNMQEDYGKFFINISNENIHNGFAWTDSSSNTTTKILNQYTILQFTDSTLLVNVKSNYTVQTTMEQAGITIHQNLHGYSSSRRTYWRESRLLKEDVSDLNMSGSTETNQMTSPITFTTKSTTKLEN